MPEPLIAMLTDFGVSDPYVGVMKGVIASRCPTARVIDLTHDVSPHDIREAAYLLRTAYRYFPAHTIFLVVVDPGVGTERHPVAIKTDHGLFVGPDNGVFTAVLEEVDSWQAVVLWPSEQLSTTFHGRDLFAPVAADLACGASLGEVGTPTSDLHRTDLPWMTVTLLEDGSSTIDGEVIHIDHFGNIVTSIGPFTWQPGGHSLLELSARSDTLNFAASDTVINLHSQQIQGIASTYGAAEAGAILALVNSSSQLEIAVNQGNAAKHTLAQVGDKVRLTVKKPEGDAPTA